MIQWKKHSLQGCISMLPHLAFVYHYTLQVRIQLSEDEVDCFFKAVALRQNVLSLC